MTRPTSLVACLSVPALAALLLSSVAPPAFAQELAIGPGPADTAAVERTIRASIAWALTKDRPRLERVIAHDPGLFIFNPDSTSVVG